jgi:hypothetical protein
MPFTTGNAGRPKGARNKTSRAAEGVCRKLVDDKDYRKAFEKRFKAGELAPALEALVWHYAFGKPTERHEHSGVEGGPIIYTWQE